MSADHLELLEKLPPVRPWRFFDIEVDLPKLPSSGPKREKRARQLPDLSSWLDEERFATLYMGWSDEGLYLRAEVEEPITRCAYPEFEEGDALELFIDTRCLKELARPTKFCHQILLLPSKVHGVQAVELTRIRSDDPRPLQDLSDLELTTQPTRGGYTLFCFIRRDQLFGYDPTLGTLGFAYRLHRTDKEPQHFPIPSRECPIERSPALFATLVLVN